MLPWNDCPAVESFPESMSGTWVFKNTRIPLYTILENLEAGATIKELTEWFDGLQESQIREVLNHQASSQSRLELKVLLRRWRTV